ncbi:hypothetical protein [Pseudovibrio sp. Tun.PSC04-5.I4]|uniref:hypothetical protein n=1 Tax=Pseudovibrio sp. Tun.PSC04-5.I4 TaxID=1798213 RepID=UPI00088CA568|nr:hypothetical protein [Pseudovibrio sp. Tun.PSC04-5.I4]SDQ88528.1 hypothetical protein SAMN04515695_1770 [Pseudovibrio sp. Tun.PSC04-5.I4]
MEDRSQLLIAATEAFVASGHSCAGAHMYEELALQHLASVSVDSRLKVAHLLCPLSNAPESVMSVLANDHDLMIGEYVAQNRSSKLHRPASSGLTTKGIKPSEKLEAFLQAAPISTFQDLTDSLEKDNAPDVSISKLTLVECEELAQKGLRDGQASVSAQLVKASKMTVDQVHSCCSHQTPDGFIVLLVGLGFAPKSVDQLLVRFWGTMIETDRMRDLQKAAAGLCKHTARLILASWAEHPSTPRYQSIFEATNTVVRELRSHTGHIASPHKQKVSAVASKA